MRGTIVMVLCVAGMVFLGALPAFAVERIMFSSDNQPTEILEAWNSVENKAELLGLSEDNEIVMGSEWHLSPVILTMYSQYYRGLKVDGARLIFTERDDGYKKLSGTIFKGLDMTDEELTPKYTEEELHEYLKKFYIKEYGVGENVEIDSKSSKLLLHVTRGDLSILVYEIGFCVFDEHPLACPHYIVSAKDMSIYGYSNQASDIGIVDPVEPEGFIYYLPYSPDSADFGLGFGISNAANTSRVAVTVEYFANTGVPLGEETLRIPAGGHASFMAGLEDAPAGWARIASSQPIQGMGLAFGLGNDPLFDMDLKSGKSWALTAPHVDANAGWISKAMLANPNPLPATVCMTYQPGSGGASQRGFVVVPARGAVQYDLSTHFPEASGAVTFQSDEDIVGFLLYDGRSLDHNWVGGLSIPPANDSAQGAQVYYVPYAPKADEFGLGFGVHNPGEESVDLGVDYLDNNGNVLGQDTASVPAQGHTSFMANAQLTAGGWARITSSAPVQGLALVFGAGEDPLYDMDFKTDAATSLTAAHVDTSGGWVSSAMLANPGDLPADVTFTLHPDDGQDTQSAELSIPAQGAVQYDLSQDFPDSTGSLSVESDQGLVGFVLYDGRAVPSEIGESNYLGGLSMVPVD